MLLNQSTKGLRLNGVTAAAAVLRGRPRIDDDVFSWPLLTLSDDALTHNITTMAQVSALYAVQHAPHVKTAMSRELYARQEAAGAWGATVASPGHLRTVHAWGVRRILLANELLDPRETSWLRRAFEEAPDLEVLVYVDSEIGVSILARNRRRLKPSKPTVILFGQPPRNS